MIYRKGLCRGTLIGMQFFRCLSYVVMRIVEFVILFLGCTWTDKEIFIYAGSVLHLDECHEERSSSLQN